MPVTPAFQLCGEEQIGGLLSRLAYTKSKTLSQKQPEQKWLECGSSGRVPAYQVLSPEFKPKATKKKKNKQNLCMFSTDII
jgi:hypothetical protein